MFTSAAHIFTTVSMSDAYSCCLESLEKVYGTSVTSFIRNVRNMAFVRSVRNGLYLNFDKNKICKILYILIRGWTPGVIDLLSRDNSNFFLELSF